MSIPSNELRNPSFAGMRLLDRRRFLADMSTGLGCIAAASMLHDSARPTKADSSPLRPTIDPVRPYAPREPHFTPPAQQVLVIFCSGALSQLDTFDYKPELIARHGQPMPGADMLKTFQGENGNLTKSPYEFRPRGESGKMTSELLPQLGSLADEFCFLHSMTTKTNTHGPGENCMSTGFTLDGFPSMGAWATYALGTENSDLPAFVAIPDPRGNPQAAGNNWGSGFLPALFQGTPFNADQPIRYLQRAGQISEKQDQAASDFLKRLNERHLQNFRGDSALAARIASYELAARMQRTIPRLTDFSDEPEHIHQSYGTDSNNKYKAGFARNCLLARRLLESGVRFVQLFNGAYAMGEGVGNWDGHKVLAEQYPIHAEILDQPAAALIRDLKQRGMLERVLVVICTEFGRMPTFQKGASGRDHNPQGFTTILAGAGVRAPFSYGETDPFGYQALVNPISIHDFHATILHLAGLNHERLSYYHNGIERRLTDVHGQVITPILA